VASPNRTAAASFDVEVRREQNYDTGDRVAYVQSHIPKLTPEQKGNYEQIMQNVNNGVGEIVFVNAPGGTGKTFLRKLIQAAIRSHNDSRSSCVVRNSCDVATRWKNRSVRFESAIEHAMH
jgi:hypothetical protein